MSALKKVRTNMALFTLMEGQSAFYWVGYYQCRRDHNLGMARRLREKGEQSTAKLFVDFARDDQRQYLDYLKRLRLASQARDRMASYESAVLSRVMGAFQ